MLRPAHSLGSRRIRHTLPHFTQLRALTNSSTPAKPHRLHACPSESTCFIQRIAHPPIRVSSRITYIELRTEKETRSRCSPTLGFTTQVGTVLGLLTDQSIVPSIHTHAPLPAIPSKSHPFKQTKSYIPLIPSPDRLDLLIHAPALPVYKARATN